MHHKSGMFKSALVVVLLVGVLFGALALLPALAQAPRHGRAAPEEPFVQEPGGVSGQMIPSQTGYTIDDGEPGFTSTLASASLDGWTPFGGLGGVNNDYFFSPADNDGDYARWTPDLAAGTYQVQVHYYAHSTCYSRAKYSVTYNGGTDNPLPVNQQLLADQSTAPPPGGQDSGWLTLGRYPFLAGAGSGWVRLTDVTNTFGAGVNVIADAVRFLPTQVWVDNDYTSGGTNGGHLWGVTAFDDIRAGVAAVADYGTVHVEPGMYPTPITVTKSITLSGVGSATTFISCTAGNALEILAGDVSVSGFTVQSTGANFGISNYDPVTGWATNLSGYRIRNNVITGFAYGIRMFQSKGEISNNTVTGNSSAGIWVYGLPGGGAVGPTTISTNTLWANGTSGSGEDFDIRLEDTYTGTIVANNTITGSLGIGEAGVYVLNIAGDLTLSSNAITGCTRGVWIDETANAGIQKVTLVKNTIANGSDGVRAEWTGGLCVNRQIIIGGSCASTNRISGNSSYAVNLPLFSPNITATFNDWGVCDLHQIEDRIYHHYDSPDANHGTVDYSSAICVPDHMTVTAAPASVPADGHSLVTVTAQLFDACGYYVNPGTMVGFTTSLGSVPYEYVEAEAITTTTGVWTSLAHARASGGVYLRTVDPTASLTWSFNGPAVSVIYTKRAPGTAEVFIDGSATPSMTLDMSRSMDPTENEYRVEAVVATSLGAGGHTITIKPIAAGPIFVDAFRSGAVVGMSGRATTNLTAAVSPGSASVWATAYSGRVVTATSTALYPFITGTATTSFGAADAYVLKSAAPSTLNPGQEVTYTITYGNNGPEAATHILVTDTLPAGLLRVRSSSAPNRESPNPAAGNKWAWDCGTVNAGMTGTITLVARVDTAAPWPVPTVVTNVAEISTDVAETAGGNNAASAAVTVVPSPPGQITLVADPTAIWADGMATSIITATVKDQNGNNVVDGTQITFTSRLTGTVFLPGAVLPTMVPTSGGVATTTLRAGTVAGTTTVTATSGAASATVQVRLLPTEPWNVSISAYPTWIRVSPRGELTSTLTITVTDINNNLVNGVTVDVQTTAGSFVGTASNPATFTTTNGVALVGLASGCTVTTATVTAAITTTGRPTATASVFFQAGLPYTITSEASPTLIRVCNGPLGEAVITATLWDECGNPVEDGTEVKFSVVQGERGEMYPTLARTVGGKAVSTVRTKSYLFGERYLDVYILSRRQARDIVWLQRVNLQEGLTSNINLTASPSTIQVSLQRSTIRAQVRDCGGNNVQDGTVVTFTTDSMGNVFPSVVTTDGGLAETTFLPGCTTGLAVITATADSRAVSMTVRLEPGPADRISVAIAPDTIRNCGGTAVVEATLYDSCNNLVKDGTLVQFTPQYGYVGARPTVAVTRRGMVTTTVTALNKALETWPLAQEQIDVTSGASRPGFVNLWIKPGAVKHVSVEADPGSIPINGDVNGYDVAIVARVADCSDTVLEDGLRVKLQTDLGIFRDSGTRTHYAITINGLVTATLTSQSVAGLANITAQADSVTGSTTVRFLPGEPFQIEMSPIPESIWADGMRTSYVVARVRDEYFNHVLDGVTVTFITQYSHFVESGTERHTTTTNIDGFAFATLVADIVPRTSLVRCIAYNDRQGYTYVFFVTPPPVHVYLPVVRKESIQ